MLSRFTKDASNTFTGKSAEIYFLMSTWRPYQVNVMHAVITNKIPVT